MRFNIIHKLFFVDTNIKDIYYFPYAPLLIDLFKEKSKYGVGFYVKNDITRPKNLSHRIDYFWGESGTKQIYYEHPLLPGLKAKMLLDMSDDIWSISVNKWYYRLAKYRFENVWPPGQHLTNLVTIKLLKHKLLTLHSGSFFDKKDKRGFLVLGASNTGKSYTTFKALEAGYGYHSEDLTVLDKDSIYTSPLISAQSDKLPNKDLFLKYNLLINRLTGLNLMLPKIRTVKSFNDFFDRNDIKSRSKLESIFILENGKEESRVLSNTEAVRKIRVLNRLELNYYKDHLLRTYSYFNEDFDIESIQKLEERLIRQIVKTTNCYVVKSRTPHGYIKQINKIVKNEKD